MIFLEAHIKRLNNSIRAMNLGELVSIDDVKRFIKENRIKNKALKITITEKNLIYSVREIKYKDKDYKKGFKTSISKVLRNSTSRIITFKTLNYVKEMDLMKLFSLMNKDIYVKGVQPIFLLLRMEKYIHPKLNVDYYLE